MNQKFVEAFNRWMDDFTNNPEKFKDATKAALDHLKEKQAGREPTYGESAAATFEAYLSQVS